MIKRWHSGKLQPAARCIKDAGANLLTGIRLALFLAPRAARFRMSWGMFWCIAALTIATHIAADYFCSAKPAVFYHYALQSEAVRLTALLLAGFVIAKIASMDLLRLCLPLVLLNALWLPSLIDNIVTALWRPGWQDGEDYHDYQVVLYVWLFLIAFRTLVFLMQEEPHAPDARRLLISALIMLGFLYIPNHAFYRMPYWYPQDIAEQSSRPSALMAEDILPQQFKLLDSTLAKITPRAAGKNYYVITFGADDTSDVFMKEALTAKQILEKLYHAAGHSLALVNNARTLADYPLAITANLERALGVLGKKADPRRDVLLLYLTSHGDERGLIVGWGDVELQPLNAGKLQKILASSGFTWKVVIISACYSGQFIEPLKDDNTIIITSASKERSSFGCGTKDEMTYFGDAYLRRALSAEDDVVAAFDRAKQEIRDLESGNAVEPSEPQIYVGSAIRRYLQIK